MPDKVFGKPTTGSADRPLFRRINDQGYECPRCGEDRLVERIGQFGTYLVCLNERCGWHEDSRV